MQLPLFTNVSEIAEFVKNDWGALRLSLDLPKRCSNCILLSSNDEICETCRRESNISKAESRIIPRKLEFARREEVVVFNSGGKDSAFVIVKLRERFPDLKITTLLVDTGFLSPVARENAQIIADSVGAPLVILDGYKDEFKTRIRDAICCFRDEKKPGGRGSYGVDFAEGNLIYEIGIRFARDQKVKLLCGMTLGQMQLIDIGLANSFWSPLFFPLARWQWKDGVTADDILHASKNIGITQFHPLETNSILIPALLALDAIIFPYFPSGFEVEFSADIRKGSADRKDWIYFFEAFSWLAQNGHLNDLVAQGLSYFDLNAEDVL
jgi:hypothetical protein